MGQRLTAHNAQYFGRGKVFEHFSLEGKQGICDRLLRRIFRVYGSADPFAAMRMELAAMAVCNAESVVLLKDPVDADGYMRSRYVSGELHRQLRTCVPHIIHCKGIAEELWRDPNKSDGDLYEFTRGVSLSYHYDFSGINLLRYDFDDFAGGKDRDWLLPFHKSMMIVAENHFRSKIGLPSLFEDIVPGVVPHTDFFTLVYNGARNPLFEWESKWGKHEQAC